MRMKKFMNFIGEGVEWRRQFGEPAVRLIGGLRQLSCKASHRRGEFVDRDVSLGKWCDYWARLMAQGSGIMQSMMAAPSSAMFFSNWVLLYRARCGSSSDQ